MPIPTPHHITSDAEAHGMEMEMEMEAELFRYSLHACHPTGRHVACHACGFGIRAGGGPEREAGNDTAPPQCEYKHCATGSLVDFGAISVSRAPES